MKSSMSPHPKKILVIDDTKKIRDIVTFFLEKEGYTVLSEGNPLKGIEIAKEQKIDLLILDIMMPELSGYEVYEALQQDDRTKDIAVIMLTAKAIIEFTEKKFFYGLYGFLSKPFERKDLVRMVRNIFEATGQGEVEIS